MTIALGFVCSDGAVICSDRQMTKDGGLKYQQKKIFMGTIAGNMPMEFAMTYAGRPEDAKILLGDVGVALLKVSAGNVFMPSLVVDAIASHFKKRKESKYAETLIIAGSSTIKPFMVRTKGSRVVLAHTEFIGAGDSSVIRFFADLLPQPLTIEKAKMVGAYLVFLAEKYIDGCGLGMNIAYIGREPQKSHLSRRMLHTSPVFQNLRSRSARYWDES